MPVSKILNIKQLRLLTKVLKNGGEEFNLEVYKY